MLQGERVGCGGRGAGTLKKKGGVQEGGVKSQAPTGRGGGLPAYILQGGTNLSAQASLVCPGSESSTVHTHEGWREMWESSALTQALSPFFQWSPTRTRTL